jgi:hypothetical protein
MAPMEIIWTLVQILGFVTWAPEHKGSDHLVFQSQEELAKVWIADGGKKEELPRRYDEVGEIRVDDAKQPDNKKAVPSIDFTKNTVIAVFAGEKNSGPHTIKIEKVAKSDEKRVIVLYREEGPREGEMAYVTLHPSHVVVIPKTVGEFKFIDIESDAGKKISEKLSKDKK